MKPFDAFFEPYAEYCLRTTFSEEELKEVFEKELSSNHSFATFMSGFDDKGVTFFRTEVPLKLLPGMGGRNSLRGEITIQCERVVDSPDTILHITIAPQNMRLFVWFMVCFSVGLGVLGAICTGAWQMLVALAMPGLLYGNLCLCRSMGEKELEKIRQGFQKTLWDFEEKYRGETLLLEPNRHSVRKISFTRIALIMTVPVVAVLVFDSASTLSLRNFLGDIFGTLFFIDFPLGMCLLHYHYPQLFHHQKSGYYSIVPWGVFTLVCWGVVALSAFLTTQFGTYPENGFPVACAYLFGWVYIWVSMIPIGLLYLLFLLIQSHWQKRGKP